MTTTMAATRTGRCGKLHSLYSSYSSDDATFAFDYASAYAYASADDNDNNDAVFVSQQHGACTPLSSSYSRTIRRIQSYPCTSWTKKRSTFLSLSALFTAYYAMAMIVSFLLLPPRHRSSHRRPTSWSHCSTPPVFPPVPLL